MSREEPLLQKSHSENKQPNIHLDHTLLIAMGLTLYSLGYINYRIGHIAIPEDIGSSLNTAKNLAALSVYICVFLIAALQIYYAYRSSRSISSVNEGNNYLHLLNGVLGAGIGVTSIVFATLTFTAGAEKQSGTILAISAGISIFSMIITAFMRCSFSRKLLSSQSSQVIELDANSSNNQKDKRIDHVLFLAAGFALYGLGYLGYYIGHVAVPKDIGGSLNTAKNLAALSAYICIFSVAVLQIFYSYRLHRSKHSANKKVVNSLSALFSTGIGVTSIVFAIRTFTAGSEKQSGTMLAVSAGISLIIFAIYAMPVLLQRSSDCCPTSKDDDRQTELALATSTQQQKSVAL
jgi:hypothetical protein